MLSSVEFSRNLEKDVVSETSGHFRRLLVSMVQGSRSEDQTVDRAKAKADAKVSVWALIYIVKSQYVLKVVQSIRSFSKKISIIWGKRSTLIIVG